MKFSQFIEDSSLSFHSPITQEEWDMITDVEFERTEEITFKTPSGKEVPFRKVKHGKWEERFEYQHEKFCSKCGIPQLWMNAVVYNYCPNCGADMKGGVDNG